MYKSLKESLDDLEKNGSLLKVPFEVDPDLEMAEIHRQVYNAKGPAILFEKVKGSPFKAASNLYGTSARIDFLFRKELPILQKIIQIKNDPGVLFKNPFQYVNTIPLALSALPKKSWFKPDILRQQTTIDQLPLIKSWPLDGGAFVTLPQVYSESPIYPGVMSSNVGMYRIQLNGNDYLPNEEIGLHYQIHRGIGIHHTLYKNAKQPFKVSIFVGGPPSHAFSAIMPLPEGMSELMFAGMLNNKSFKHYEIDGFRISNDTDFVITGEVQLGQEKEEGPFGDHLGYYSLRHPFPFMKVHKIFHKKDPIWHFTVVGRPPAEDSGFGYLIHQIAKNLTPKEFPGVKAIHAVDEAGVHPLLLAIGSERYMPFREPKPEEILTQALRILGSGQTSLAKYLMITDIDSAQNLNINDKEAFFVHILSRVNWQRDLHFITKTTIDTLDYSGEGLNQGSKLIIATVGSPIRTLACEIPNIDGLPQAFGLPKIALPGVLILQGEKFSTYKESSLELNNLVHFLEQKDGFAEIPLIVIVDDANFTAHNLANFIWITFTRSNPSHDIRGVSETYENKHWGCRGSLIIDARIKPHHAPELIEDPEIKEKVGAYFSKGGPLFNKLTTKY